MKRVVGLHPQRQTDTARAAFIECRGEAEAAERQRQIEALPIVEWKGAKLRAFRCNGETGRGPHTVNVPESLLWALHHFGAYRCPFHA